MTYTQELLYEPQWAETPLPPDLRPYLPRIRQLLLEGKPDEANALVDEAQKKAGFEKYMNFDNKILYPVGGPRRHTAFTLTFRRPEQPDTRDYLRFLDMQNGMITSMWTDARGSFRNESFCAYDGDVTVNRFTAPKGQLDLDVEMQLPRLVGSTPKLDIDDGVITLATAYNPDFGQKGYAVVIRFLPKGGTMTKTEKGMRISGADGLTVVAKIERFESDFTFDCAKPVRDGLLAMKVDFDKLLKGNEKYIGERMDRSRIHLSSDEDLLLSGEELLRRAHSRNELDPTLLEKLYDMGRFFQIYETGKTIPPFTGQHNINTNLQVCAAQETTRASSTRWTCISSITRPSSMTSAPTRSCSTAPADCWPASTATRIPACTIISPAPIRITPGRVAWAGSTTSCGATTLSRETRNSCGPA